MPEYTLILHLHRAVRTSLYPIFNKSASESNRWTSSIRQFLAILNRRHNLSEILFVDFQLGARACKEFTFLTVGSLSHTESRLTSDLTVACEADSAAILAPKHMQTGFCKFWSFIL
jgi:hypothetical protein